MNIIKLFKVLRWMFVLAFGIIFVHIMCGIWSINAYWSVLPYGLYIVTSILYYALKKKNSNLTLDDLYDERSKLLKNLEDVNNLIFMKENN